MARSQLRGNAGEALAAAYLELIGYAVEAHNIRLGGVEIDLVANDGRTRVLVEVKLRSRTDYGGAALAVNHAKRERLRRAAQVLVRHEARPVRIDVIAIEPGADGAIIHHYRNAVMEGS